MGRRCTICYHPDAEKINRYLIQGTMTMTDIANEFNVSIYALRRHKSNHLQESIDEAQEKIKEQAVEDTLSTLEAVDEVIKQKFNVVLDGDPTYSQYLNFLKFRSELLGESAGPTDINVEWGPTVQEDGSILDEPEGLSDDEVEEIERYARNN